RDQAFVAKLASQRGEENRPRGGRRDSPVAAARRQGDRWQRAGGPRTVTGQSGSRIMNELAGQKLCEIIRSRGLGVCDDPRQLRGLLSDHCPGMKREVHVLMAALSQRVVQDLLATSDGLPWEVVAARLASRLQDEMALAPEAARWAVATWAVAVGKKTA